jgi:hypothetical protein
MIGLKGMTMSHNRTLWLSVLVILSPAIMPLAARAGIVAATGQSEKTDPAAAGDEAATKAKAALKDTAAKVVLVFDSLPGEADAKQKMLDAVAKQFDAAIIYGCSAYNAITQETVSATVGVLALGGDIQASVALAPVEKDDFKGAGVKIGEGLKDAAVKAGQAGKLLVLIGACHVPKDNDLTQGVLSVLGEKFPVAGGAAMGDLAYFQGKVQPMHDVGLLLSGDFKTVFSLRNSGSNDPMDQVNVARDAAKEAVGETKDKLVLLFTFECGGRRDQMGAERPKELDLIKAEAGACPIFGFYGSGEIGKKGDKPAQGVGYHISVVAITSK